MIVVSTVRSSVEHIQLDLSHRLGFLANPKRFNVAVTRAKQLLVVVGNPAVLGRDRHWGALLREAAGSGAYRGCPLPPWVAAAPAAAGAAGGAAAAGPAPEPWEAVLSRELAQRLSVAPPPPPPSSGGAGPAAAAGAAPAAAAAASRQPARPRPQQPQPPARGQQQQQAPPPPAAGPLPSPAAAAYAQQLRGYVAQRGGSVHFSALATAGEVSLPRADVPGFTRHKLFAATRPDLFRVSACGNRLELAPPAAAAAVAPAAARTQRTTGAASAAAANAYAALVRETIVRHGGSVLLSALGHECRKPEDVLPAKLLRFLQSRSEFAVADLGGDRHAVSMAAGGGAAGVAGARRQQRQQQSTVVPTATPFTMASAAAPVARGPDWGSTANAASSSSAAGVSHNYTTSSGGYDSDDRDDHLSYADRRRLEIQQEQQRQWQQRQQQEQREREQQALERREREQQLEREHLLLLQDAWSRHQQASIRQHQAALRRLDAAGGGGAGDDGGGGSLCVIQ